MNTSEKQNQEPIITTEEVIISPHECSTKGGEKFTVTFPQPLSTDTILLLLQGSVDSHKLICQRDDDYTVSVTLPAHSPAEVVDVSLYRLPSDQETLDHTYHPQLLVKDQIIYTDMSHYLAELLVQSVTDGTQAFYSVLPPLASLDVSGLKEFDLQLANALSDVDLPDGWSLISEKKNDNETLLHFAARNRLSHLFTILVALPGGRQALLLTNAEGKVPLDLAQENGIQEVIDVINGLNEPLLQEENLPMESMDVFFLSQLQIMKDIDLEWIQRQRNSEGNNPSILRTPHQLSFPGFSFPRRSSIAVMEGRSLVGVTKEDSPFSSSILDVLLLHESDRKSWSRVVGDSRTRSVGTGMNELDRLTAGGSTVDDRKNHQISSHHHTKGVWLGRWSISCPILDEGAISDLIYSTLTSPGTTENSFLPDFAPSTTKPEDHTHLNESITPHQALLTLSTGSEVSSTSPSVLFPVIPAVCIEDPDHERTCMLLDSPVKATPTNDDSTQQATKDSFSELPNLVTSSGEDEEEDEVQDLPFNYPLLSKSAPAISLKNEASPHSDKIVVAKPKSHSISEQGERCIDDDYIDPSYSKVPTTPTTPVTTPTTKRSHRKSQSMSGVVFHDLELEESLEVAETESHSHETESRSHGSSFISTSSKQATSSSSIDDEDEDDNHYVTASENDLKSKSPSSLLSPSGSSIERSYLVPLSKDPDKGSVDTLNSPSEDMTSGDDIVDGSETREGRGRRYSLNVITNVDDYNASSEDEAESKEKPFKKSSTVSENLSTFDTPTHQTSGETEIGEKTEEELEVKLLPKPTEEDVTLSDIDVKLDSLNNSFSVSQDGGETSITPIDNTSPLEVGRSESEPCLQRSSPLITPGQKVRFPSSIGSDAKQTISMLKTLTEMDKSELESPVFSVKETESDRLKSLAELISRPVSLPSEPSGLSASFNTHSPRLHTKVSRNSSSASDTAVVLGHTEVPTIVASSSSLDFVQSPDGGRTSPRSISFRETSPFPQSPLFISKSPLSTSPQQIDNRVPSPPRSSLKVSPNSPLEKKARSVDNLLHSDDQKTAPGKLEEERTVRMNVRFETEALPTCQGPAVVRREQHKDIQSYLGILEPSAEVKEPPRKGISKLFRRDSKKEKRKTRENSTSSLDTANISNHDDKLVKEKNKPNPPLQTLISQPAPSPEKRNKARSQTIHGDMNLSEPENKELRSLIHTQLKEGASSIPENDLLPRLSPPPPPHFSPTETASQLELDDTSSLSISIDEHPLLIENEPDTSWYRTIDRRLRRSINKHERGRQGAIFDWIRTERHIYRSIVILKVVFRDKLSSELGMTEDILDQLFPSLNELLEVSKDFSNKLHSRQRKSSLMIDDISDILLNQFTGEGGEKMRVAYTDFICRQSEAIELYRDLERKRHKFLRLMNALYQNKYCERRKLPDFYLLLTQRVAKYVEMMKKLLKETETLKLDHLDRLKKTSVALQSLVKAIDQGVEDYNNHKELESIQSRLEIQIPRNSNKSWAKMKGLKHLDLRAQNRRLVKTGDANWQSQGKQLAVHLVLVTDLIIFLTERDQKYHLATLHDLKPPVIPLFDLLVRLNASVRSGVQLLLLEQGDRPEMFRIEFQTKKLAKEWEETLNKAVENCKIKGLKCEHFGSEVVLSGDEAKDEEDEEYDKDPDPLPDLSPNSVQRLMIQQALDQASSLLFSSTPTLTNTTDSSATRHSIAVVRNHSPQISSRNKPNRSTTFYSSKAQSVDCVDPKLSKNKKVPERGQSFLDKKGAATAVATVPSKDTIHDKEKQVYLECIGHLKESVEYLMEQNELHVQTIANLKEDIRDLKEQRAHDSITQSSPVLSRPPSRRTSLKNRPHSIHSDLFESDHPDFSEDRRSPMIKDRIHGSINHWNH